MMRDNLDEGLLDRLTEDEKEESDSVEESDPARRIREASEEPEINRWLRESGGRKGVLKNLEIMADDWIERENVHPSELQDRKYEFINFVRDNGGNVKWAQKNAETVLEHARYKRTKDWSDAPDHLEVEAETWANHLENFTEDYSSIDAADFHELTNIIRENQ
jgi:hypothetical protein